MRTQPAGRIAVALVWSVMLTPAAAAQTTGRALPPLALESLTGRDSFEHGTNEMPVWGTTFRALEASDGRVGVRIDNLVAYMQSLQNRRASPPSAPIPDRRAAGARLFRIHCATCHGESARGNGPMAALLRRPPTDLTRFTAGNGGVFPNERLRRVIDGRDVPSHGPGDMPVWGDIFRRTTGGDDAAARERIDALLAFLESIQSRAAE